MIRGIHTVRKRRDGRPPIWYVYANRGGPLIHRHEGREKPILDDQAIRKLVKAHESTVQKVGAPTLQALIDDWRPGSPEWKRLTPNTRRTWGSALNQIEKRWGGTPLSVWSDTRMTRKVVQWRDSRADTPRAADFGIQVLRALLEFGRLRAMVAINVATGIPQIYKNANRSEIVWTEDDLARFASAAADLSKEHVLDGVRLAALTGLRREDLVTLKWTEVHEAAIVKRAAKESRGRRRTVVIPRHPELDRLLEELKDRERKPGVETVLATSRGKPWGPDSFSHAFAQVRDHADITYVDEDGQVRTKHIHDLRGTFCTKLLMHGLSDQDVAEVMGWSPDQVRGIRRSYVDQRQIVMAIGDRLRSGV